MKKILRQKFEFQSISQFRNILMGIAITEVLFVHLFNWLHFPSAFVILSSKMVFTQGFLLLSGIGLYYSYVKNSDTVGFYCRRIKRMWLPYMLMALPFVLIFMFLRDDITIIKAIGWITSIGYFFPGETQYCNMWYIAVSLLYYALFPLMFHFIFSNKNGIWFRYALLIIVSISITIAIYLYMPTYYHLVSIGLPKQTMFIVGIGIGYLCYRKMKVNLMVLIVTTLSLYLLFYSLRHSNVLYAQYASMTEKLFTIPIICLVLFKIKPYVSYLFNCLQWMGKYTLEIYVLHLMIKHLLFLLDVNGILMAFVSIISSIILAPYVNRITNNLTTRTMQLLGVRI